MISHPSIKYDNFYDSNLDPNDSFNPLPYDSNSLKRNSSSYSNNNFDLEDGFFFMIDDN